MMLCHLVSFNSGFLVALESPKRVDVNGGCIQEYLSSGIERMYTDVYKFAWPMCMRAPFDFEKTLYATCSWAMIVTRWLDNSVGSNNTSMYTADVYKNT